MIRLVVDLHCHLLAGLDDGPATGEVSMAMARAFVAAGIETVAATPHVNARFPNDAPTIATAVAAIGAMLSEARIPLHVATGAEIDLFYALDTDDRVLRSLGLGGGPWLLIEAPHQPYAGVEVGVQELLLRGQQVLLAHPERSPAFLRDPAMLQRLVDAGARAQVSTGSLTGRFGRKSQIQADEWLLSGLVHVVASDAHNLAGRPPGMQTAMQTVGRPELEQWLTDEVPKLILAGKEVPPGTPVSRRRGPRRLRLPFRLRARAKG